MNYLNHQFLGFIWSGPLIFKPLITKTSSSSLAFFPLLGTPSDVVRGKKLTINDAHPCIWWHVPQKAVRKGDLRAHPKGHKTAYSEQWKMYQGKRERERERATFLRYLTIKHKLTNQHQQQFCNIQTKCTQEMCLGKEDKNEFLNQIIIKEYYFSLLRDLFRTNTWPESPFNKKTSRGT